MSHDAAQFYIKNKYTISFYKTIMRKKNAKIYGVDYFGMFSELLYNRLHFI